MSLMLLKNPSLYYGNGRRKRVGRVVRRKRGGGFMDALKSAHNWIKSNKIISTVGNALGKIGVPYAGAIGLLVTEENEWLFAVKELFVDVVVQ